MKDNPPERTPPAEWQCRPPKQGEMVWNGLKPHGNNIEICPCDHTGDHWVLVPLKSGEPAVKQQHTVNVYKCWGCGSKIPPADYEKSCVCTGCDKLFCSCCAAKFDSDLYCAKCQADENE
jgi:hypothetical protein